MEVDRINFASLKSDEITKTFEDLDVNGDGKITNADLSGTGNNEIKSQIMSILNARDDEPVLEKTGKKKKKLYYDPDYKSTGIEKDTSADTFEQDVKNSKGVVYVVMGNLPICGPCCRLSDEIQKNTDALKDICQIYNINWNNDKNKDLCWSIYKKLGGANSVGFPVVVKFVDGEAKEIVCAANGRLKENKVVSDMISKAKTTTPTETASMAGAADTTTTTASKKTDADITKAAEDLLAKYPPATVTGDYDIYSTDNPEIMALKQAMDGGAIEDLVAQGFSRDNIISIIEKAYPKVGIKANNNGGFDCPYGHGDAQKIYDTFVDKMSKISSSGNAELLAQVSELNIEINTNNHKLNTLKATISTLKTEIENLIEDAIKKSEEIQENQKEESAKIVKEELEKYISGNGNISYDAFKSNVSGRLDTLAGSANSELSNVVLKLINAEGKMVVLKGYIDSFQSYVEANKVLSDKVLKLTKTAASTSAEDAEDVSSRCDPIGFTVNKVKYDFFIDKDQDGKLSNENEFLGAKDGWTEMVALDKDGDGKVTASEMGELKIVTTDESCNHSVNDAANVFGAADYIDLNSYKSQNQEFSNGNTLLGTFSLQVDGKDVKDGYNTLDKLDWLDVNYEFSDEEKGINRFATGNIQTADILDYSSELTNFNAKYNELDEDLSQAWAKVGITKADVSETIRKAEASSTKETAEELEEKLKNKCGITQDEDS